jgi:hypothetical protein
MASGGARFRSGPAPDPNALRRDRKDDAGWLDLPVSGRRGPVPVFPLPNALDREVELWGEYWLKPQAVLWERNGQELEVALHVRTFVEAEALEAAASLRTLVRQQLGELLLTIPSMQAARVRLVDDEVSVRRADVVRVDGSARDRLKALNGGAK